jgi:hypothetical protein
MPHWEIKIMKTRNFVISLSFFAVSAALAQGPLYDRIEVNLPYPVTVNGTVLQPGEYEIRQHEDAGGSRVLHFFKDSGMKLETTAMAIPALDNKTPEKTKLELDHFGNDYYLNKIWVQGKNYGYEFPIPPSVRKREQERSPAAVVAQYQPAPAPSTAPSPAPETAQVTPPPAPQAQPEPAPAPEPPPAPKVEQAPSQVPATPEPVMPATAANWLNLVLGGLFLSGSGLALRRARG